MIAFSCPHCDKTLRVKDELAGKRGKCPACGTSMQVPGPNSAAVTSAPGGGSALAGGAVGDAPTLPPMSMPRSEARTLPPAPQGAPGPFSLGAETVDATPVALAGASRELIDFLAPAQQADELGRLGSYRILKVLGHGGMGVVYLAEDPGLERKLALKAMLPTLAVSESARLRFLREARTAAAIEHDHIVPIFQVGEDRGVPFIAMPYLKGEPLDERLRREARLPVAEVLRIGRETAEGLAAAHGQGLVHRDIKPANLWLESPRGRVKILDFGLARAADGGSQLTQQGAIVGTPSYMAPEQVGGDVDARADLFSLGVVLYCLATGQLPFQGSDTVATLVAVATHQPPPPLELRAELPTALSDLVMRLLAKQPDERPASADDVVRALQSIEADCRPVTLQRTLAAKRDSGPPPPLPAARSRPSSTVVLGGAGAGRKRWWLAAGATATLLCLGVATALLIAARPRGNDRAHHAERATMTTPAPSKSEPPPAPSKTESPPIVRSAVVPQTLRTALGLEFMLIPKGKSWLGGSGGPLGKQGDVAVEFKEDFYLGKYEVTYLDWEKVMGTSYPLRAATKSGLKDVNDAEMDRFPVERVSWDEAQQFLGALNKRDKQPGWTFRLPKEAEWEYACRNGPMTDRDESSFDFYLDKPTLNLLPGQANFKHDKSLGRACKVGSYPPNRLGLCDMHGNLNEWCDDELKSADGASLRTVKGGGWWYDARSNRANAHIAYPATMRAISLGFRVARVPTGQKSAAIW